MGDEQFDDLKQFIDSRISQSEQLLKVELKQQLQVTNQKIDDGLAGVGEAIEEVNQRLDEYDAHDKEVEQRLTTLEHHVAA